MNTVLRRLKYYGIGFTLGLLFLFFFFKNRGCSWLPSNRVKDSLQERILVLPTSQEDFLKQNHLKVEDVLQVIKMGDVNFSKSRKHDNPKVYLIEGKSINGNPLRVYVTLPVESFVAEIHLSESTINEVHNTLKGKGKLVVFPKNNSLLFIDSVEIQKQKMEIPMQDKLLSLLKRNGLIDFSKTNFSVRPKAIHTLLTTDEKGREIQLKAYWYKEKVTVTQCIYAKTINRLHKFN
jgi:hypothetical protein